ncbi:antibiotic biosynthesis monooxygenase family protein [Gordonia sp. DT30]|uniref:antibiotic biosynthesis monooxygenase family protein n=1 Tax=Gordonia sp. DT30 TaxID=3416546 RepID=UPI003CEA5E21
MTFVNITALTFPEGTQAEIEQRFATRKKSVDSAAGFRDFELLCPAFGEERYFVLTRWDSREDYDRWSAARPAGGHDADKRRGMSAEVLGFDVVVTDGTSQLTA